MQFFRWKK